MGRIGILTGGGDCPGLNAVIRAVVRTAVGYHGDVVLGFRNGWRGVLDAAATELTPEGTRGILHRGGTILGTSRIDPFREAGGVEAVGDALALLRLDGLIVVGGEGTLAAAVRVAEAGVNVVGIPKSIDNDIAGTDATFGFDTAVQIATDAIDRLHSTAESHHRVMVVETMGRHTGWIALSAGIAGGADVILIPEEPFDVDAVGHHLKSRYASGHPFSIAVVAEGAMPKEGTMPAPVYEPDAFGRPRLGGIGAVVAREIEARTGFETRVTILGHVQRGGSPTAHDRVLATRFGVAAADLAAGGRWGRMVALRGDDVTSAPLDADAVRVRPVPPRLAELAEIFFG